MSRVLLRTWSREGITFEVWFNPEYQEVGKDISFLNNIWDSLMYWIAKHRSCFAEGRAMEKEDIGLIEEDGSIYILPDYFRVALGAGSLHRTATKKLVDMGKVTATHEKSTGKTRLSVVRRFKGIGSVRLVKLDITTAELVIAEHMEIGEES